MSVASHGPIPDSTDGSAPRSIREHLLPEEARDFDVEFRRAMREATESLDLTEVLAVLERWRRVARLTEDEQTHRRMLERAEQYNGAEPPLTVPLVEVMDRLRR